MTTPKEQALRLIASLPDDCTFEDVQYHLYVRAKIERGIQDVDAGRVVSQEEVERRVGQLFNDLGLKRSFRSEPGRS